MTKDYIKIRPEAPGVWTDHWIPKIAIIWNVDSGGGGGGVQVRHA